MADELLKWRLEFPILGNTVYLISHSLGAMPRETFARLTEYAETWATRGVRAWAEGWWDMPVTTGNDLALITAESSDLKLMAPADAEICRCWRYYLFGVY